MKLAEVKPLIDQMVADLVALPPVAFTEAEIRIALESAFVAGVRSGLKFTSNAKFAEVFVGVTGASVTRGKKSDK